MFGFEEELLDGKGTYSLGVSILNQNIVQKSSFTSKSSCSKMYKDAKSFRLIQQIENEGLSLLDLQLHIGQRSRLR